MSNIPIDNLIIEDLMRLIDILSMKRYFESTKELMDFILKQSNAQMESIGILKTKFLKINVPAEGYFTDDFNVLGWVLRLTWVETDIVVQAIAKRTGEKEYVLRSKTGQIMRKTKAITATEVISSPECIELGKPSPEEIIIEQQHRQ